MAKWNENKVDPIDIHGGQEFSSGDNLSVTEINAIVNNSFYASKVAKKVDDAIKDVVEGKGTVVYEGDSPVPVVNFKSNPQEQLDALNNQVSNVSNPNLLINGDFRVNQRGQTSYSGGNTYCVDRWYLQENTLTFDVATKTLTNNGTNTAYMYQKSEDLSDMLGKDITISAKIDGVVYSRAITFPTTLPTSDMAIGNGFGFNKGVVYIYYYSGAKVFGYVIQLNAGQSIQFGYCKIEQGNVATPNSPRPYAEELALCQRYYVKVCLQGVGYGLSGKDVYPLLPTPVTLRTSPTIETGKTIYINGNGAYIGTAESYGIAGLYSNAVKLYVINQYIESAVIYCIEGGEISLDAEL